MKKIFLLAIFLFPLAGAGATGVSVRPEMLDMLINSSSTGEAGLLVENKGDEPAFYNLYVEKYKNSIQIIPNEFQLQPEEDMLVSLVPSFWINAEHKTKLSIVSRSLNSNNVSAAAGIKIPVSVKVENSWFWLLVFGVVVLLSTVLAYVFLKATKRK